jgi:flagellar protein FlaG
MSAMGAFVKRPELMAVSDAAKSPDLDTRVMFGLVGPSAQSSIVNGAAQKVQAELDSTRKLIEDSVRNINLELELKRISLNFSIDEDSERIVVQVVESESGKLIRQIPPDEILALRKRLEELTGIIFDTQA